jgi:hypothetical protein
MIIHYAKCFLTAAVVLLATACSIVQQPAKNSGTTPVEASAAPTTPSSHVPKTVPPTVQKSRAIGTSQFGKLEVMPTDSETVEQLGAPSCNGTAEDYQIKGKYKIQFMTTDHQLIELASPKITGFIQPKNEPVSIQKLTFADHDVFVLTPNYTDCHGITFYLVDVSKDGAFSMQFVTQEGTFDQYDYAPKTELKVENGQLLVQHGGAAGNESVVTQRFTPNFPKHLMEMSSK